MSGSLSGGNSFDPLRAKEQYQRAHLMFNTQGTAGDRDALALLKDIVTRTAPSHVEAHLLMAEIYARHDNYQATINVINKLHRFSPQTASSLLLLAKAQLHLKHFTDCKVSLDHIFKLNHGETKAILMSGIVATYEKRYDEAIKIFLALQNRQDVVSGDLYYYLALAYYGHGEYKKSVYYLKDLMSRNGSNPKVKRLYEFVTDKLVDSYVSSVFSDKRNSWKKKFWTWIQSKLFNANLVEATQAEAATEVSGQIMGQQIYNDELTGVYNVKAFLNYVPSIYATKKAGEKIYFCLLDVDFFGTFNNCYGHGIGDLVLKDLADVAKKHFPDRFYRVGGEEFCWIMASEDDQIVLRKAEEFRADIEKNVVARVNEQIRAEGLYRYASDYAVPTLRGELILVGNPITISQGIAIYGVDGNQLEEVKNKADACLYVSKHSTGRNSVIYRSELISRGESPIKYTPRMMVILGLEAAKANQRSWWDYAETLSKEQRLNIIENARLQEEREGTNG